MINPDVGIKRGSERGIALITAIWMSMIGVMLVTSMASILASTTGLSSASGNENKARFAATSGIQARIAELIQDRPTALGDTPGILITEVRNAPPTSSMVPDASMEAPWDLGSLGGDNPNWVQADGTALPADEVDRYTGQVRNGAVAIRLEVATADHSRSILSETNLMTVVAGDTYDFGFWIYREQSITPSAGNLDARCTVIWSTGATSSFTQSITVAQAGRWLEMRMRNVRAPAGAISARLQISGRLMATPAGDDLIVDDAIFETSGLQNKFEYIEIQNFDSVPVDLVARNYWISVGDTIAANAVNRRGIYPFPGTDSSLVRSGVGVIITRAADSPAIAALSGLSISQINWYGLRGANGNPFDTSLHFAGGADLADTVDSILIGFGLVPPLNQPFWFGFAYPDTAKVGDSSFQKQAIKRNDLDDTAGPIFDIFRDSSWTYSLAPKPGVGLVPTLRSGYDGAGDTWYTRSYDSFVLVDTNSFDIYYRTRVYDEGAKINLSYLSTRPLGNFEENVFVWMLQEVPPTTTGYANTLANAIGMGDYVIQNLTSDGIRDTMLTPNAAFYPYATTGAGTEWDKAMRAEFIPYTSIYGRGEPNVFPININMAETMVLRAAFVWALADNAATAATYYPTLTLANAQTQAKNLADQIYRSFTGGDTNVSNDSGVRNLANLSRWALVQIDTSAIDTALAAGRITQIFDVASTNYFTVYSTGFVFNKGAKPMTDTPLGTFRIIAVVRRQTDADKADIIFWREHFEQVTLALTQTATMTKWAGDEISSRKVIFPLGTWRYPRYAEGRGGGDPLQ